MMGNAIFNVQNRKQNKNKIKDQKTPHTSHKKEERKKHEHRLVVISREWN
jgi:hypothetical protein